MPVLAVLTRVLLVATHSDPLDIQHGRSSALTSYIERRRAVLRGNRHAHLQQTSDILHRVLTVALSPRGYSALGGLGNFVGVVPEHGYQWQGGCLAQPSL